MLDGIRRFLITTPESCKGVATLEAAFVVPIIIFLVLVGIDLTTISRYSASIHWLAITAARVATVEKPDDGTVVPPSTSQLKLPTQASQPSYLPAYVTAAHGCNANQLSPQRLRVLNLVLGEANRILPKNIKTSSTWTSAAAVDAGATPLPGEMVVVPVQCKQDPTNGVNTDWKVCMNIPLMIVGSKYVCFQAGSTYWKT